MIKRHLGTFITILVGSLIILFFYGNALKNLNTNYFASGGDGLKDYFGTFFYIEHDTALLHSEAMNYPHGEHIFFTGSQPSISVILRFINNNITDISQYTVGIINFTMLFSLLLGIVFLYLLLVHFKLPSWYSMLVSIGIAFLSPQLARMSGHFSLSYLFAIPLMLYMIAKFDEKPRYWLSALIGIFVLWALGTHVYMLGFHASIILLYWLYSFIFIKGTFKNPKNYIHLGLQFILPFLLFLTVVLLSEHVDDRTSYPWGFFAYKAVPEGVFLPLGKPYAQFIYKIASFHYVQWEAIAYIGLVALIGFIFLLVLFFTDIFNRRFNRIGNPANNTILNIFFWTSFIMLLYSFGIPFIIPAFKQLVHYLGPLKQMRGIARFSWLFFYIINIYIFYQIWQLKNRKINRVLWGALVAVALSVLWYDAWLNVSGWSHYVNNEIPALTDRENKTAENEWVEKIDTSRYQATIPIPYFHIGSENFWENEKCDIARNTMLVSWKTGLPTMGVMLSRTSISQTVQNLELFRKPYRYPSVIDKMIPSKAFLIITKDDCAEIPQHQKELVQKATPLYQSSGFSLYELPFDSLTTTFTNPYSSIKEEYDARQLYIHGDYQSTSEEKNFTILSFSENTTEEPYYIIPGSTGAHFRKGDFIYIKDLPKPDPQKEYIFSVWVKGLREDLVMRSRLLIQTMDERDWGVDETNAELFYGAVAFDGNWALIERKITLHEHVTYLRWKIYNNDIKDSHYTVSHMMIRPADTDIYKLNENWLMKNNWFYKP